MTHTKKNMTEPSWILKYLFNVLYMFNIIIWYYDNDILDGIGIKYINCNNVFGFEL